MKDTFMVCGCFFLFLVVWYTCMCMSLRFLIFLLKLSFSFFFFPWQPFYGFWLLNSNSEKSWACCTVDGCCIVSLSPKIATLTIEHVTDHIIFPFSLVVVQIKSLLLRNSNQEHSISLGKCFVSVVSLNTSQETWHDTQREGMYVKFAENIELFFLSLLDCNVLLNN